MSRIILSLLLFLPGSAAVAAEAARVPDGSDCSEVHAAATPSKSGAADKGVTGGEAGTTPGLQGSGADAGDRLPTHSWRSFLPGMLR